MIIQFFKEVYFTGFVIFSKWQAGGKSSTSTGIAILALIQWIFLLAAIGDVEMVLGQKLLPPHLPRLILLLSFFVLYVINARILDVQGYGSDFEEEFHDMDKSRKTLLIVRLVVFLILVVVFCIVSFVAHNHFLAALRH
jgi:hypothetical protein